jgi:hypothetical protein
VLYALSYQMYKYEHGLTAAEQRAADVRTGEAATALRDLRLHPGRFFRLRCRVRPARGAADAMTASVRVAGPKRPERPGGARGRPRNIGVRRPQSGGTAPVQLRSS